MGRERALDRTLRALERPLVYLNLNQIAESFGVSERVVRDWVRNEGLPNVADRGYLLFDRARVSKWASARGLTAQAGFLAIEKGRFATEFGLEQLLRAGGIWRDLPAAEVREVLVRVLTTRTKLPEPVLALLAGRLRAADGISWAPVGSGFALPHFRSQVTVGRASGLVALLLFRTELALSELAPDRAPITRLFFFVPASPRAQLDTLGRLAKALAAEKLRAAIAAGAADEDIFHALAAADAPAASPGSTR